MKKLLSRFIDPRQTWVVCDCGDPASHTGAVWHPGQPLPPNVRLTQRSSDARVEPREVIFEATVIRCGCGDPDSHNGSRGPARVCPTPSAIVDHGRVAYYHRNPLKRLQWRLYRALKDRELRSQAV